MILQGVLGILIPSLTYAAHATDGLLKSINDDTLHPHADRRWLIWTLANVSPSCEPTANEFPCVAAGFSPSEDDVGEESGLLVQDTDRKKAQEVIQAAGHTVQRSATAISRPTYATNRGISHKNTCHDGSRGRHSSLLFWSDRVSSNP